jgi:hypothetical protein
MTNRIRMPTKKPPSEKPGAEILDLIFRATIELMEDQARSWQRSARQGQDNDLGPKISAAIGASGERPSATAAYVAMCERCPNNLADAVASNPGPPYNSKETRALYRVVKQ